MAEIKTPEVNEIKKPEPENFKNIQPEKGMTGEKAKEFWDNVFDKGVESPTNDVKQNDEKQESGKVYYDDNGEKYRVGDNLEPNKTFEVNGYTYRTDDQGRTISAEGTLRIASPEHKRDMDKMEAVGKGDQKEGDQRGHLIGHRFDASDGIENMVPMDGKVNQGDYAKLENTLADAVKAGADVKMKVEPVFSDGSYRPSEFRVSYSIDGDKEVVVFKNRSDN